MTPDWTPQTAPELRRERLARIAAKARPDTGVMCMSASARSGAVLKMPLPEPAVQPAEAIPWLEVIRFLDPNILLVIEIQSAVAADFCITRERLVSREGTWDVTFPRQIAMYLARDMPTKKVTCPQIGRLFNGRDNSTIRHAVAKIALLIKRDPELAARVSSIRERLTS